MCCYDITFELLGKIKAGEISFEELRKYYEEKEWMLDRIDQLELDLRILSRMAPYGAIQ